MTGDAVNKLKLLTDFFSANHKKKNVNVPGWYRSMAQLELTAIRYLYVNLWFPCNKFLVCWELKLYWKNGRILCCVWETLLQCTFDKLEKLSFLHKLLSTMSLLPESLSILSKYYQPIVDGQETDVSDECTYILSMQSRTAVGAHDDWWYSY